MAGFHKYNLGRFGESLYADMNGYVHTSIREWMTAPVDLGSEKLTRKQLRGWAKEQAAASRKQIALAEIGVAEWIMSNQ